METCKIIIIPDLHGREFWRDAVKDFDEGTRIVFLGDYLDPYEDDWIYWTDAFKSLQDIIAFKKQNKERVTLLFGNHDLHYLFSQLKGSCYNSYQEGIIRKTFEEDIDCFQMATEFSACGKRFLFSHGGIHPSWVGMHTDIFGTPENITADTFNHLMFTPEFISALSNVSFLRGGGSPVGSMIWSDIDDFQVSKPIAPDTIQICGHSRVGHEPKGVGNVYCLDCGRVFTLDEIVNHEGCLFSKT